MSIFKTIRNTVDFSKLRVFREITPFFIACCLFLCSTGIVSSHFFIVGFVLIFLNNRKTPIHNREALALMKVIVCLSIINEALSLFRSDIVMNSILEIIPYSIFILFTVIIAQKIDEKTVKWLLFFILLDISIAVLQKYLGINSFFAVSIRDYESDLFYNQSVNGLNVNSAALGAKVFLGLLLYERYPNIRFLSQPLFYTFILVGAFLCFNRTAMVAICLFFCLKAIYIKKFYLLVIIGLLLIVYVLTNEALMNIIFMQFFRGADSLSAGNALSERDVVYPYYWNYITNHPLCGNCSFKYYIDLMGDGRLFHAHNSYLQTLANNGFIIGSLYFLIVIRNIRKDNYIYIIPILAFAFLQTFIFWGLSLNDLIFYNLLLCDDIKKIASKKINRNTCAN